MASGNAELGSVGLYMDGLKGRVEMPLQVEDEWHFQSSIVRTLPEAHCCKALQLHLWLCQPAQLYNPRCCSLHVAHLVILLPFGVCVLLIWGVCPGEGGIVPCWCGVVPC